MSLNAATNKSPNFCWRAICVYWGMLSVFWQAGYASLPSPYCLLVQSPKVSQRWDSECPLGSFLGCVHHLAHMSGLPVSQECVRAFHSSCEHLTLQVFLVSLLVSFFVPVVTSFSGSCHVRQLPQILFAHGFRVRSLALSMLWIRSNKDKPYEWGFCDMPDRSNNNSSLGMGTFTELQTVQRFPGAVGLLVFRLL